MSIATYISAIETDRNIIRNKLIELGLAISTDKLDKLAAAIEGIINQGAVNITVQEGDTYTIPKGYHNGNGTVSGVAGGGNYNLQAKTATPTKKQQNIAPDSGFYGLSGVTVNAIPEAYQDVTSVTAVQEDVLSGKIFVQSDGTVTHGGMLNNGTVDETLDVTTITYTIPKGFHNGNGVVKLVLESKVVTPTKEPQEIVPTDGKVLSSVTVEAIPEEYVDTSDATAAPEHILAGYSAYVGKEKIDGEMAINDGQETALDADNTSFDIAEGYHDGTGRVFITLESQSVVPSKEVQEISPESGKVLSHVTVEAIPEEYVNTSDATARPEHILVGESAYVGPTKIDGEMPNNGEIEETLDTTKTSYTIPEGYHNGEGHVSIVVEERQVTPEKRIQEITPNSGKVISKVVVDPIPDQFQDVSGVTAKENDVLKGTYFVNSTGALREGNMIDRGAYEGTIDGLLSDICFIPPGKHNGSGFIKLTDDIEKALAAI